MGKITQSTVDFITNLILKIILAVAAIGVLIYFAGNLFNPMAKFFHKLTEKPALTIENTPITVEDVRAVGKLVTANFYDEMIIKTDKHDLVDTNDGGYGQLVIIQKANVRIGVDLTKLAEDDIAVVDDTTVVIKLPPVECLHVIMNPTDTDVYDESKGWSLEQMKEALRPTEDLVMEKVMASEVMDRARQNAEDILREFFLSFGYKQVRIRHTMPPIQIVSSQTDTPTLTP